MSEPPSVCYYLKQDPPLNGLELRYSLRSLQNIEHGEVFMLGGCPPWATNVTHIKYPEDPRGKWFNLMQHVWRLPDHDGGMTQHIILMADDVYVTEPTKIVPRYRGTLQRRSERVHGSGKYREGFVNTLKILETLGYEDPLNFDIHIPQLLDRDAVPQERLKKSRRVLCGRSLTANLQKIPSEPIHRDWKVRSNGSTLDAWVEDPSPFLSSNERTFKSLGVRDFLDELFPDPSPFEGA